MPNFLDEYLIRLGATVDQTGMARFQNALREAASLVELQSNAMIASILRAETEIVAGFAAIGMAAVGLADKVAIADQEYRLFALHMYMSKDAARGLKVAMDALGQPLENLAWDKELRERTRQLIADQHTMAVGGDFDEQMRKIRDVRFEFTRMEVELQYLGMHVVTDFMKALGLGPDELLKKLRAFNDWVTRNLPAISDKLVKLFLPIWKDICRIMMDVWQVVKDFAQVFTTVIGLISGDKMLQGTVTFEKFATAVEKLVHWLANVADFLVKIVGLLSGALAGGTVGGLLGSIVGGVMGIPGGPLGIAAGIASGGATGTMIGGLAGGAAGGVFDVYRAMNPAGADSSTPPMSAALGGTLRMSDIPGVSAENWRKLAGATGGVVSPELLSALARTEHGWGGDSPKGAMGVMQLMPKTAAAYGIDPRDPVGNLYGGTAYLRDLMKKYGGNEALALGAYNAGPGRMDAFLAGKATLPGETKNYIAKTLANEGRTGSVQVGTITITIQGDGDPTKVQKAVVSGLQEHANLRVQRNLAQNNDLAWGY